MAEHNSKLIPAAQALVVRKLLDRGDLSINCVAKETGLSYWTVKRINDMTDTEWEMYLEKRERLDKAEKPAKPKKAVKKTVKKPEPKPEAKVAADEIKASVITVDMIAPAQAEEPAGVCPKCGAVKPDAKASWCWKCGADLRSERAKTVINLTKIAGVLNKAIELLEDE